MFCQNLSDLISCVLSKRFTWKRRTLHMVSRDKLNFRKRWLMYKMSMQFSRSWMCLRIFWTVQVEHVPILFCTITVTNDVLKCHCAHHKTCISSTCYTPRRGGKCYARERTGTHVTLRCLDPMVPRDLGILNKNCPRNLSYVAHGKRKAKCCQGRLCNSAQMLTGKLPVEKILWSISSFFFLAHQQYTVVSFNDVWETRKTWGCTL